jgi:hypothetical protein
MVLFNAKAQLVLNEVYPDPNSGKSEFFELYNTSNLLESTDNYTLVTFFRFNNNNKGFYVLDLPAISVTSKGFVVGSAANPFNYQGVTNSTNTNFSWNDNAFLSANNGSLTAWKQGTSNLTDGNVDYDQVSIASNFNDFFNRLSASGASYIMFLYKNGALVNSLLAGTGGFSSMSTEIISMPPLYIDMSGTAPDFTINFPGYGSVPLEFVTEEAGSDNGYIRTTDGACSSWNKSSSGITHTPQMSNGSMLVGTIGSISVYATIARGTATTGSSIMYGVTSAPVNMMPVEMGFYIDNGTTAGQWDANDTFIFLDTISVTNVTEQYTFFPYDANIIIVTKAASGCIDNLRLIENVSNSVLATRFLNVKGYSANKKPVIEWSVAENESSKNYEVQKSNDGINFVTETIINTSGKVGMEGYSFRSAQDITNIIYYRIKINDKNNGFTYSRTIALKETDNKTNNLTLLQNPVSTTLNFAYSATSANASTINIYSATGAKVFSTQMTMQKGMNTVSMNLDNRLVAGTYVLEVVNSNERSVTKLIKQ